MWPFSRTPKAPTARDVRLLRIEALERYLPLGMEFEYLGRRLRVTGHWITRWGGRYHRIAVPRLLCDYADDHGVLHSQEFSYAEAKTLATEHGDVRPEVWP